MAKDSNIIFALGHIIGYFGSFKQTLSALFEADDSIRGTQLKCLEQARDYIDAEIQKLQQVSNTIYDSTFNDPNNEIINNAVKKISSATNAYNDITTDINHSTDEINTYVSYF